jgi:hypothetical protein
MGPLPIESPFVLDYDDEGYQKMEKMGVNV